MNSDPASRPELPPDVIRRYYTDLEPRSDLIEEERRQQEQEQHREAIKQLSSIRRLREKYSNRLFWLLAIWLLAIACATVFQGFESIRFELPEIAFAILIGSTTVSVVGLFAVVARYLFPRLEDSLPPGKANRERE